MIKMRQDIRYSATAAIDGIASTFTTPRITTGGSGGSGGDLNLRSGYPYPGAYPDYYDKKGKLQKGYSGALQVLAPESVNTSNFSTKYYPGYRFIKGTSDIDLSKKGLTPLTDAGVIDDTTKNLSLIHI